jgi:gluconolactonase
MSLFAPPKDLPTRVHVNVVDALGLKPRSSPWTERHLGRPIHSFLEGPSFDRDGNLYVVNAPFGQILRIRPDRSVEIAAEYPGIPNGLKIHRSGEIFIADRENGIMRMDPVSGRVETFLGRDRLMPGYKGLNDLFFRSNGDLYFTDQGSTDLRDPTGRVFRLGAGGKLDLLIDNAPSPNGIVMNPAETHLFIAVTFGPQVWRCGILADGSVDRLGAFQTFSGGYSGPDGLAMDETGGLAVAVNRLGSVFLFDKQGEPAWRIRSSAGLMTTNLAYGGPGRRQIYITESETGSILVADAPVPGQAMFAAM